MALSWPAINVSYYCTSNANRFVSLKYPHCSLGGCVDTSRTLLKILMQNAGREGNTRPSVRNENLCRLPGLSEGKGMGGGTTEPASGFEGH